MFAVLAYNVSEDLPNDDDEDYISEKYATYSVNSEGDKSLKVFMGLLGSLAGDEPKKPVTLNIPDEDDDELNSLLISDIETDPEDSSRINRIKVGATYNIGSKTPVKDDKLMYHI